MIYVDPIFDGPRVGGNTRWSHMGTDDHSETGLAELHAMAAKIGMRRDWFQNKSYHPHYDLFPARRAAAIRLGAIEVDQREYVKKCSKNPLLLRLIARNEAAEAAKEPR